ncbi:hypothetical protein MG293_019799 [Ovis ammon polii]|uniref:Uncharacterized protein n=1 Tax=Ovis ammon polii TaxID=230172 RepID=A0AAD4TLG5_OVIAM|nr:hypothetical protein MG293_019799 [Ovis ammon polii]
MDLQALCRAGVPVRSGDATFPKAMDNVTVRQGESATLRMPFPPSSEFDSTLFQVGRTESVSVSFKQEKQMAPLCSWDLYLSRGRAAPPGTLQTGQSQQVNDDKDTNDRAFLQEPGGSK